MNRRNAFAIAMVLGIAAVGFCATPPITDGLVIQLDARSLNLEDGALVSEWPDATGNGNTGSQSNPDQMPIYRSYVDGFDGPAIQFDGIDDWLEMVNPAPFKVNSVTALAMAYFQDVDHDSYLFACQSTGDDRFRIAWYPGYNTYVYRVGNSDTLRSGFASKFPRTFAVSSAPGDNGVNTYVENNLLNTATNTSDMSPMGFNIGSIHLAEKDFFKGYAGELLFFNRGLSQEEVFTLNAYLTGGIPLDMAPANGTTLVPVDTATLSWSAPAVEAPVTGYVLRMSTTDPNLSDDTGTTVVDVVDLNVDEAVVEAAMPIALDFLTSYYWRVDTVTDAQTYVGTLRQFTTAPNDTDPIVDAGSNYITWLGNLPFNVTGAVNDNEEGDVSDSGVAWSIGSYPGDPTAAAMQLMYRGMTSNAANDLKLLGHDPNTLAEWIGTDTRQPGNPLSITLSGLPAGSYIWTSLHHDYNDQRGTFNVYVDGVLAGENLAISTASATPTQFTTQFTTDGSDVMLVFDKLVDENTSDWYKFFAMNAFTLTDGTSTLNLDFDNLTSTTAAGYESYKAEHEVPGSFTAQSFPFGATTVSVLPQWGKLAAGLIEGAQIDKTSTDPLLPAADFTTLSTGSYVLELTVADNAGHVDSDTMTVQVLADACEAAQASGDWAGFNYFDIDNNCVVDMNDITAFAASWLEDLTISEIITN